MPLLFLRSSIQSQKGQGLVEYLIIVALVGVATISTVKLLQSTINIKLAETIDALQGVKDGNRRDIRVDNSSLQRKDFSDFMRGAANDKDKQ